MLHVPGNESRHPAARRTVRLDKQSQFRGTAGSWRTYAPGEPRNGGGSGRYRTLHRCAPMGVQIMQPFRTHTGVVAPLDRANVDTDQIIPKQFLKRIERTGFGQFVFNDWRLTPEGKPNPSFVLNQPQY